MTETKNKVPAVYPALANILKSLQVDKNGVLPGNMGGKPYLTAVDVSAEAKKQFVDNNLVILPQESVVKHENIVTSDRAVKITVVIEGTYTIVSTEDGSSVVVSGTGDGLANGTAVASNIASTNALKNALLRTFLITEQSVEDESKNGPKESAEPKPRAVQSAKKSVTKGTNDELKSKIRGWIGDSEDNRNKAVATQEELSKKGLKGAELQKAMIKELGIK